VKPGRSFGSTGGPEFKLFNLLATIQRRDGTNQCTKEYSTYRLIFVSGNMSYDIATNFKSREAEQKTVKVKQK
jgi:hypothetical protein